MTKVAPKFSHKLQYVSYQTFLSITPRDIHLLQKKSNVQRTRVVSREQRKSSCVLFCLCSDSIVDRLIILS